jgi:hypothetical protein
MFILGPQRDIDAEASFQKYEAYLKNERVRFPPSAYALATSDWYFGFSDHRAPHDAWLEALTISEPSAGERNEQRETSITIRLLSAYHDGHIELHYPRVFEHSLVSAQLRQGQGDWRYDEFRLNQRGHLVHEIEWAAFGATNNWVIAASDVHHKWLPK